MVWEGAKTLVSSSEFWVPTIVTATVLLLSFVAWEWLSGGGGKPKRPKRNVSIESNPASRKWKRLDHPRLGVLATVYDAPVIPSSIPPSRSPSQRDLEIRSGKGESNEEKDKLFVSLAAGDCVVVFAISANGWMRGRRICRFTSQTSALCAFPRAYVRLKQGVKVVGLREDSMNLSRQSSLSNPRKWISFAPVRYGVVKHKRTVCRQHELPLHPGDHVMVMATSQNGWMKGRRFGEFRKGVFPSSYVELLDDLTNTPWTSLGLDINLFDTAVLFTDGKARADKPKHVPIMTVEEHNADKRARGAQPLPFPFLKQSTSLRDLDDAGKGGKRGGALGQTCVVCLDAEVGCVVIPCGHLSMCFECATRIAKGKSATPRGSEAEGEGEGEGEGEARDEGVSRSCPVCRTSIENVYRVYL